MKKEDYKDLVKLFHQPAETRGQKRENYENAQMIIELCEWRKNRMELRANHTELSWSNITKEHRRLSDMADRLMRLAENPKKSQAQRDRARNEAVRLIPQLAGLKRVKAELRH